VAASVALAIAIPSIASAAPVVSQANGRLVTTTLLTQGSLDSVVSLKGATATNTDGSPSVTSDVPLDATAISALTVVAGTTDLFGGNGIIQLGAVGQYAQANGDGSSAAFSGAVTQAPSLIGVAVQPSSIGSPSAGSTAEIKLGSAGTDPVSIDVTLGALAASAQETAAGVQTGQYNLADAGVTVGGTVLSPILASLRATLQTALGVASGVGVTIANPINADGTLSISLADLLAAAGVANLNLLPQGTDLLSFVPLAVVNKVTSIVNTLLGSLSAAGTTLGGAGGLAIAVAVGVAQGAVNLVLSGLASTLQTPLGTAIAALAQLQVNIKTNNSDGSFTQTALRLGIGPSHSIASVDLADATVGPNAGPAAVSIINPSSISIAGVLVLLAAGAWFAVTRIRRRGPSGPQAAI
jgi:hypothetical protein